MRSALGSDPQRLNSIRCGKYLISLLREIVADELQNIGFIIHQKYSMSHIFALFVRR